MRLSLQWGCKAIAGKKNPAKMIRARLKSMAGADTTATGEPDYAKMFLTLMHRLGAMKSTRPDTLGSKQTYKGIAGGD
jgi:hypothetical protein